MEGLAVLAALTVLAIPVAVIWLIVTVSRLQGRVAGLEARLGGLERPVAIDAVRPRVPGVQPVAEPVPPVPVPDSPQTEAPQDTTEPAVGGPWAAAQAASLPADAGSANGPVVLSAARASALADWLKVNWIYAVSALSLAFAGVFFVQYGVENGLLPPAVRVAMALLFGAALVAAGEVIRRRSGDGAGVATAYLPSTFSGAGIVSMFAGVLAARQLYGLIGVEAAFAGLVTVAVLAVVLGWFYGPFLAAVGLLGAGAAPFVVGGSSDAAYWLYGYFALLAAAGLAVDAVRRWAWVSVLALAIGYGGCWLTLMGTGGAGWYAIALTGLALLAVLVPCLRLAPDHDGPMLSEAVVARGPKGWPIFPTRLAAGAVGLTALGLTFLQTAAASESVMVFLCLAVLAGALTFWSRDARALSDLAALPALGFVGRIAVEGIEGWPLADDYLRQAITLRVAETGAPGTVMVLLAMAVAITLLAAWRSGGADYPAPWAAAAALVAPVTAVGLELFWAPSTVLGAYPWALHIITLAALMTALATRFARADRPDMRRAAYATLATLSLIALALFLVTTKGALTLALAALVVAAALLDRRFRLPEMTWFLQAAVVGISYRLVVDPGLGWAIDQAAWWEVFAAFGGTVVAMVAALRILHGQDRRTAQVFLESGAAASAALFANVLITRWLTAGATGDWLISHWGATLNAMPWLILMLVQLYRLTLGGALRWLRIGIALIAGLIAAAGIGAAAVPLNPLFGLLGTGLEGRVIGPYILDTLLAAYGLPALLLLVAQTRLTHVAGWLRWGLTASGCGLAALWVGLEIRRFWRGDDLSVPGVTQPELYCYTIALMALGAALLYQAIARGSDDLRRAAMGVIGLTVAKVFLLDAAGLSGLTRVASFVGLGLALAGLAWLNRWAATRART